MTFEDWMRYRGLAESSIVKYEGAVSGVMSEWAMEAGLLDGPLVTIHSHARFLAIAAKLRELPIYQERNVRGHNMYNSALNKYAEYLAEGFDNDIETDIDEILSQDAVSDTEKRNLIKVRIGQGTFRQKLISYWKGCAVTGYKDAELLVASHIKPWRAASNSERLDHFNGLLLLPTIDKAFDAGLITFSEPGEIVISPMLEDAKLLGISTNMSVRLNSHHQSYLQFHREWVFRC